MIRVVAAVAVAASVVLADPWAVGLGTVRAQGITTRVTETPEVSHPGPFSNRGHTVIVPRTHIEIDEGNRGPAVAPTAPNQTPPAIEPVTPRPALPPVAATRPVEFTGKAKAIGGDTLEVGGVLTRLYGIAAPAEDAACTAGGSAWPCGQEAAFAMAFETAEHWVSCIGRVPDTAAMPGEPAAATVAVCRIGPYDLAALMVRKGWALAEPGAAPGYAGEESEARLASAGLWRGGFVPPEAWRTRHSPGPRQAHRKPFK